MVSVTTESPADQTPVDDDPPVMERTPAEQALAESEQRYRTLFESIDQGFCVFEMLFDADGAPVDYRFLEANPTFERHTGLKDAVGKTALALVPNLERHWLEIYGRVALTGEREQFIQGSPAMGGRWFDVDAFRVGRPENRRVGLLFRDISDRKRAEDALRESEARLRSALEIETVGVIYFTIDGRVTEANDAFLRMSGYDRDDLANGRIRWDVMTPPEAMPESLQALEEFRRTGQTTPYEKEYVRKDGQRYWALFAAKRVSSDLGIEFVIDITAAKAAEAERRRADERLHSIVDNIRDYAIYAADPSGVITEWTDGAARVKGYSADEVVGRHVSVFYTPEDIAAGVPQGELEEAARDGRAEYETWKVRRSGHRFWANEITTAIRDADGRLVGFTRISRDLTFQKELEEEREKALDVERNRREAAEAFLSVLSHELRTPVTTIYGTASLIAREPDRDDLVDLVGDVQEEADRLVRMIDDLLVLSRADRGLVQLSPEPILLQRTIPDILAEVERRGPLAKYVLDVPSSLPAVLADPTAVRQVVHNLVTNAAKYAGADGPVTISAREVGSGVEVLVQDEGPGLGPDPEQVFSLFYRAPHTAKLAAGTGIGLYVARELMKAMGGSIEAQSRDGRGAVIRLCLPTTPDLDGASAY
jgi:PAS domain S-box-containing protein